jgi:tRNA dimethylallyltransferase
MKPRIVIICGPTATSKTRLAVELAKKYNGEIVSADSRQVYRGMNVITGKDIGKSKIKNQKSKLQIKNQKYQTCYYLVNSVAVWMLDIVQPTYRFNVSEYVELANKVINNILSRGKLPIIVGGTGLYLRGLFGNIETLGIPPNNKLRKELNKLSVADLQNKLDQLGKLDKFNQSDINNPRRLIRAIEIAFQDPNLPAGLSADKAGKAGIQRSKDNNKKNNRDILTIGLTTNNLELYQRIDQRVDERVEAGAEEEIHQLLKSGYNWNNSALGVTLGYAQWRDFFEGKSTREEVVQKWKFAEHAYARRQLTWFKKEKQINWFDISGSDWQNDIITVIKKWYTSLNGKED